MTNDRLQHVPWFAVSFQGGFWDERQATNRDRTIPAIYHQTHITGRIDAWKYQPGSGQPEPHIFWDSDTAKWMEAVAYSLTTHPNPEFERQINEVIDLIARAQLPDGYANSHFIAIEPENRWRNLRDEHELYCAGHLIEAAVTYSLATGQQKLLDVLCRYADHIDATFGPGDNQKHGYPGHPELELALIRLYHMTGEERYLKLSKYFVDERGHQPHYYDQEARERGEDPHHFWARDYRYCQAEKPIREQTGVAGHAVRAGYLYAAVADLALETGDAELRAVSRALWDDLTQHHLYITGGVGPAHDIEGFAVPYDLPNESAYGETCAAIALIYWSQRMFALDPHRRYMDVIERALYNGVLSGVSYEGSLFFQANPLASYPNVSPYSQLSSLGSATYYRRSEWFSVACCPSNLARLVASVGGYFYSVTPNRLYVHLYNPTLAQVDIGGSGVQIEQQTRYPWDGDIQITLTPVKPARFELALRIPGWCRDYRVTVNGEAVTAPLEQGYLILDREWHAGDTVRLKLAMPVERIAANPQVRQDIGRVALQRGPVVYCLEEADNGAGLARVALPPD
ncbi:MAG: glycoside hydrolase family 127 protein, partial [Anaerolineae bacterium]|nr:glycoside hydrolase family 127 protein [Anaerolineae bacterium]